MTKETKEWNGLLSFVCLAREKPTSLPSISDDVFTKYIYI